MIYFQRYFNFETIVLENFSRIEESEPSLQFNDEQILNKISDLVDSKILLKEQAEAILKASKQTLTLICGGPGTGKTYTAGYLLKVLLEGLYPKVKGLKLKLPSQHQPEKQPPIYKRV